MIQIYQRKEEMLLTIITIISATGHVIIAGIYNFFLPLSFLYLLCPQKVL